MLLCGPLKRRPGLAGKTTQLLRRASGSPGRDDDVHAGSDVDVTFDFDVARATGTGLGRRLGLVVQHLADAVERQALLSQTADFEQLTQMLTRVVSAARLAYRPVYQSQANVIA